MWSYYGAKTNIVDYYPKPIYDSIKEPFAGSARYSLKYFDRDVTLVDKYEIVIETWKWLQQCSEQDVLKLPRFKHGENINSVEYDCAAQRYFVGFVCGWGSTGPRKIATTRLKRRPNSINYTLQRIAKNLFKIRHWKFIHGTYEEMENTPATWFIDPPYKGMAGSHYPHGSKAIDYNHLGEWCKERLGQTIVCESPDADWLDFHPLVTQQTRGRAFSEGVWINSKSAYNNRQLQLM